MDSADRIRSNPAAPLPETVSRIPVACPPAARRLSASRTRSVQSPAARRLSVSRQPSVRQSPVSRSIAYSWLQSAGKQHPAIDTPPQLTPLSLQSNPTAADTSLSTADTPARTAVDWRSALSRGDRSPARNPSPQPQPRTHSVSRSPATVTLINNKRQQHNAYATIAKADKRHHHADQGDAGSCH